MLFRFQFNMKMLLGLILLVGIALRTREGIDYWESAVGWNDLVGSILHESRCVWYRLHQAVGRWFFLTFRILIRRLLCATVCISCLGKKIKGNSSGIWSWFFRQWGQFARFKVGSDCLNYGFDGIVSPLFKCPEDAHQHRLAIRSLFASVSVAVFSEDDRRANRAFGMIVFERHIRFFQKRQQVVSMSPLSLESWARVAPKKKWPKTVSEARSWGRNGFFSMTTSGGGWRWREKYWGGNGWMIFAPCLRRIAFFGGIGSWRWVGCASAA